MAIAKARTLVLSAWDPEVAPLARLLRAHPAEGKGVTLAAVGVGLVDAAVGAARAIAGAKPARVIFVGTAGVYPSAVRALPIGTAALADEVRLISSAALRGQAYAPAPLVSSAATTKAPSLARKLGATGAALENLEAFSVARAADAAGIPFAAVLGVSNVVGPNAHAEWRANHLAASRAACHVIWSWMKGTG
jgi:nucleoside phosphorylase